MLKKEVVPIQNYFLDTYPNLKDLNSYTEKADQMRMVKHVYAWEDKEEHKKYSITILCHDQSYELEWWMHEESVVGSRMLWFYKTQDLSLIFTQLCQVVGAPKGMLEDEIDAHREEKKNYEKRKAESKTGLGAKFAKKKTADITAGASFEEGPDDQYEPGPTPTAAASPEVVAGESNTQTGDLSKQSTLDRMLSGDLKLRPIGTILRTAKQADATGHLTIEGPGGKVMVQLGLGKVVHAFSDTQKGSEIVLDLFTWKEGKASFIEGIQPEAISIQETADELISQGEMLLENLAFLEMHRINEISVLKPPPFKCTEEKLVERLEDGAELGIDIQKYVVENVDGAQTVTQIASKANLSKCQCINIVGNLLKLGLVNSPEGTSLNTLPKKEKPENAQAPPSPSAGAESPVDSDNAGFPEASGAFDAQGASAKTTPPSAGFSTGQQPAAQFPQQSSSKAAPMPPSFIFGQGASSGSTASSGSSWGTADNTDTPIFNPGEQSNPAGAVGAPTADTGASAPPAPQAAGAFGAPAQTTPPQVAQPEPSVPDQMILGVPESEIYVDSKLKDSGRERLLNPATGIYSNDSFQYLLDVEFQRAFRFGHEFTFVVFCINIKGGALSNDEVIKIAKTIEGVTREVDNFGHFGEKGFGIILPSVRCEQATSLCSRIINELPSKHPELSSYNPTIHFGLASVPYDEKDLPTLVSTAQKAMLSAVEQNIAFVQAQDLKSES